MEFCLQQPSIPEEPNRYEDCTYHHQWRPILRMLFAIVSGHERLYDWRWLISNGEDPEYRPSEFLHEPYLVEV